MTDYGFVTVSYDGKDVHLVLDWNEKWEPRLAEFLHLKVKLRSLTLDHVELTVDGFGEIESKSLEQLRKRVKTSPFLETVQWCDNQPDRRTTISNVSRISKWIWVFSFQPRRVGYGTQFCLINERFDADGNFVKIDYEALKERSQERDSKLQLWMLVDIVVKHSLQTRFWQRLQQNRIGAHYTDSKGI